MTSSFGIDFNMAFIPHGDVWRRSRRELQKCLRPSDLESYQPIEQRAVNGLLRNLLSSPDNFEQHIRQSVTQTLISNLFIDRKLQYARTSGHVNCLWDRCVARERQVR